MTQAELDAGQLKLTSVGSTTAGSQNTGDQELVILGTPQLRDDVPAVTDAAQEFGDNDGQDEIVVRVKTTTNPIGATAQARLFLDDGGTVNQLDASEARAPLSITTAGPVARFDVSPAQQTRPSGVQSAPYTITARDNAGRLTQIAAGTTAVVEGNGATIAPNNNGDLDTETLSSDQLARGTFDFRATGPGVSVYNLTVTQGAANGSATLSTTQAATITADEVDIVTSADDWNGFGNNGNAGTPNDTNLAPTQSTVTFNFRSADGVDLDATPDDANTTVTLDFTGTGVTFGGQTRVTKTVTLNAQGVGSIVLDVDPASIQNGDFIDVAGSFTQRLTYAPATAAAIQPAAARYVTALKGTTTVVARVVDTYGNPVTSGEVSADIISGPNANANNGRDQRKPVGADGTVSFTFTDASAVAGQTDTVEFRYFTSQFEPTPSLAAATTDIRYTADGQGSDYTTLLDGVVASGPGYNPAANPIVPLSDAFADNAPSNDSLDLNIVTAEPNTSITVTVNNGALILEPTENNLSQASASVTAQVTAGGVLPNGYRVVGTKSGTTTVTVVNAGRTETSDFVVAAAPAGTGRNVELTGPSSAVGGDVVTFVAKITDAFGNPVAGFPRTGLNVTVSGPGAFQDGAAQSDANGEIALNVRMSDNADSPVTVNVTASGQQFGAAASQLNAGALANSAPGLTASDNTATATIDQVTDLETLRENVRIAEANLASAEADLAEAQTDLDVAQAQLAIATAEVDRLQERKQNLRQKLNKAKREGNRQKAKTTRKKLRAVKRQLADARDAVVVAQTRVDGEQTVVDLRQQAVTEAEEALAQAQADLDEAQN